jgi:hypothetical protein
MRRPMRLAAMPKRAIAMLCNMLMVNPTDRFTIMWLRKRFVPQILPIVLLLFVLAAATDDLAIQNSLPKAPPNLKQALYIDVSVDSEDHDWKAPTSMVLTENDVLLSHLAIKTYLVQTAGIFIPSSAAMFFQPNRGPPILFL